MTTKAKPDALADAVTEGLRAVFISPNEGDSNGEAANVVDAIFAAGRDIRAGMEALAEAIRERKAQP